MSVVYVRMLGATPAGRQHRHHKCHDDTQPRTGSSFDLSVMMHAPHHMSSATWLASTRTYCFHLLECLPSLLPPARPLTRRNERSVCVHIWPEATLLKLLKQLLHPVILHSLACRQCGQL
jgi:hypothetical protein